MSNLESGAGPDVGSPRGEATGPVADPAPIGVHDAATPLDLDLIERDLRDVETTLARLADGSYFADQPVAVAPGTEVTGSPAPGLDT